ncbi:MAG: cyanophycin synthetase, partial [Chitinophagaceae bacterium]
YQLDLPGIYQAKNICTLLQTLEVIGNNFVLDEVKTLLALATVKKTTGLSGRWEVISQEPKIVLDVAHNPSGISELVKQLKHEKYDRLHIVFGMVKDKEAAAVLSMLPVQATYYFTQAQIPRALPALELQAAAAQYQLKGAVYPDVASAIRAAKQSTSTNDLILVCGSIFLVAEVEKSSL